MRKLFFDPKILFSMILVVILLITAMTLTLRPAHRDAFEVDSGHVLVIDAGHGGFDGGAISDDGTKESDINLAIAIKMKLIADLLGQETVMTRTDDSVRSEFAAYSEHEDLVHRTKLINQTPNAILFSIHQNDFPTSQPSGAQVLYSAYGDSSVLGNLTHDNLVHLLDPENRRLAEPAPKNLYITANAACPAVLVECGFMSNNFEVLKLCDSGYQTSIATILIGSMLQYLNSDTTV